MDEKLREYHDVSMIFPMMGEDEFQALKEDIQANGLLEPIWIDADGKIIDGRNRHKACIETNTPMKFKVWNNGQSLVSFVVSLNLKRRHLSASQRAACALDIKPILEEEARKRQIANLKQGVEFPVPELIPERENGESRDQAGKMFGVSGRYVSDAEAVKEKAPDLFEQVKAGEISLTQAKREVKKTEVKQVVEMPSEKYRVIYADPPWAYGNTMPDYYGVQDDHYPVMTVKEISELPIVEIAEENAVLFLWVTSPILEESFQVVNNWGFKYKASFIWDKVKHVMGHYNSVRHEILLICVRGSCQPDVQKLFDSVITEERTEHSKKPEIFRQIIDTIYPFGRRIELFARTKTMNWDVYGNEI